MLQETNGEFPVKIFVDAFQNYDFSHIIIVCLFTFNPKKKKKTDCAKHEQHA